MRVVIASLDYPPQATEGVARQRQLLAGGLARLGHQVHVVTRGSRREDVEQDGVRVHRYAAADVVHEFLPTLSVLNRPLTDSQWLAEAVRDVVARERADIVDVPLWLAQPLALVREAPCPIAVWLQTSLLHLVELQQRPPRPHETVLADIDRFVLTQAAGCIADSTSVLDDITRLYGVTNLASRTLVVHPGIEDSPVESRVTRPAGRIEALLVGRLEQRKGTRLLLDVLPALLAAVPALTLRFVGRDNSGSDGFKRETGLTYPEAFSQRHPSLMSRVQFEGYVAEADLAARYRSADLLLHPALYESFGLSFIEAMRASLPVVTFATGGAVEVFGAHASPDTVRTNRGALLVPLADATRLVHAVTSLAASIALRDEVGRQGRQTFERCFTCDRMARDTADAYGRIVAAAPALRVRRGRIFQIMEALQDRDAVSRITRTNAGILAELGAERPILSLFAEVNVRPETGRVRAARFRPADGIIFHYWGFSRLEGLVTRFAGRKAIHYHNITPPHFFAARTPHHEMTRRGYAQLARLAGDFDLIVGDSNYNLADYARHLSVTRPALCLYPVIDAPALQAAVWDQSSAEQLQRESDGPIWLFVGRFAPNKRQDQVMVAFDHFVAAGGRGRLLMVGDMTAVPTYVEDLEHLQTRLAHGHRITLVPSVPDEVLRAFYRVAALFVCASEHEGFCVPIAEAMAFGVPTIALDRGAVGETIGDAGVLVSTWDPCVVADAAATLLESPTRRVELADRQRLRLGAFSRAAITDRLSAAIRFLRDGERSPYFYPLDPRRRLAPPASPRVVNRSEEQRTWSTSTI